MEAADKTAKQLGGIGVGCDVTNRQQLRAAFDTVCQTYGGVDILNKIVLYGFNF
jgi:NAD(P)-dependent dehydrogenase (short-subunit alcohol dehydrogenase family)